MLKLSLGYSVVENVFWIWYDTDTILADADLAIGDPMQSVVDGHLRIKLLDINWQELPADANNAYRCLLMLTDGLPI